MLTINVTGHRPNKLFGYIPLKDKRYDAIKHGMKLAVKHLIDEHHETEAVRVISGMAIGVDQLFVLAMLDAKAYYEKLGMSFEIIAAVPCENQSKNWNKADTEVWKQLLKACDEVNILQKQYTPDCMEKRNKYMVDQADATVAVWNGTKGGTANCVKDAEEAGNEILLIDPKTGKVYLYSARSQAAA